jgi:hypothetical protein
MLMQVIRRVFSFPIVLAGALLVLAVLTAQERLNDPDLWWHLKMGQVIWTSHAIPTSDLFSYTAHNQAIVPQEWLAQVTIYAAYLWGGYSGLMLWLCLLISALLCAAYLLCFLYSGNPKVAFAGAMTVWFFAGIALTIRPQLIAYLLFVAELIFIHLGRTRNPRWFFFLPAVFAVWINCHGSFMLGIIVAGVFLFSSLFHFEMGSLVAQPWEGRTRKMFLLAMILSLAALFLNPVGIRQILYPFDTLFNEHLLMANVEEWAPLKMSTPSGIALLVVLLCCLLLPVLRRAVLYWHELLLLALGTWLAVSHVRLLAAFGILAAPVLVRQLADCWDGYNSKEDRIWPNALFLAASLFVAYLVFPNPASLEAQVEDQSPFKAVKFLEANNIPGPMLNEYSFGGYLIWAAPQYPVMIDGRTDVYEWSGFLGEFGKWASLKDDPHLLLDKYKVNFCLLNRESPMANVLPLLQGWKQIYSDNNSVIFARTPSAHVVP